MVALFILRKGLNMENFINWLADNFYNLLLELTDNTVGIINKILNNIDGRSLADYDINLVLFSDTPILVTDLDQLLMVFFSIFYTVVFVVCVWKIIKKVFRKITGWTKW